MSSKIGRTMLLLAMFLFASIAPIAQSAPYTPPNPSQIKPTLIISALEPQAQNATVSSTTGTTMTYTADITVTKPPLVTVTVKLSASCSASFPTTVTPDSITFTQTSTVAITVTVVVPAKAPMSNNIVVMVTGVATMPGLSMTAVSSAILGISQYYEITAKAQTIKGSGNPQEFRIDVNNNGNGNDSFSLDIVDKAALEKDGYQFIFSALTLYNIAPNGNASFKLRVTYGLSTPSGKHDIKVKITSLNSTTGAEKPCVIEVPVSVNVGAFGGGGSQTYLVAGLIVLIVIIALMLAVMVRRRARVKVGGAKVLSARPIKKVGDENGEDEPLKEPEEILNDQKDAKLAEHED
jgi:hypothetical protein